MPTYDYRCKECGHEFEEQQTIAARNVPRYNPCPECGSSGNIITGLTDTGSIGGKDLTGVDCAYGTIGKHNFS